MSKRQDTQHPNVEIAVRNFGPIAEVNIDLRPLTVFVGPSNTGKTYFATLVYTLHGIFSEFPTFPKQEHSQFPLDTSEAAFREPPPYLKAIEAAFKRCFDVASVSDLIHFPGSECNCLEISLKLGEARQANSHFSFQVQGEELSINTRLPTELMLYAEQKASDEHCYYLPATRSGIMQSHRVVASSLMDRIVRTDGGHSQIPTLSAVVVDFMKQLPLYEENRDPNGEISAIADALEADVLAGKIIAKPLLSGYPEFFYQPQGEKDEIRLNQASSMVSELAPLVLFLRSGINPGDTLIIEEPEAHLHPGAQADMAIILARIVRAGVRVIITTHSDWMLQEIGNLIRVGELENAGEKVSDLPTSLQREQVGVWHFQKSGKVEEIPYDRINGVEPMEYLDVAEDLYNRSARLQNRLEKMKGGRERE